MKLSLIKIACLAAICIFMFACQKENKASVKIENVFINALPPGRSTAAAYLSIKNDTNVMQVLNYVHSPIAEHIELHRNMYEDGMMSMRPVKKLSVAPGTEKVLDPGGYHLMVMGINENLEVGDTFDVTFEFESGLVINAKAEVKPHG